MKSAKWWTLTSVHQQRKGYFNAPTGNKKTVSMIHRLSQKKHNRVTRATCKTKPPQLDFLWGGNQNAME
ncbi:hypothetical protein PBY51_022056 [Eleginops maclovinus]|uniref:Uncharacterized protein n=1 Tax=Eleginops maclovinus TaxID=56733 RepID=A0AAN8AMN1_ELEMC|nr:hypothetical protein PBY51_022056 [Eleginops maclovinus]